MDKPEGATHLQDERPPPEDIEPEDFGLEIEAHAFSSRAVVADPTDAIKRSPNYTPGWPRGAPEGVTIHTMEGWMDPSISWLCNPASQASAHFCISESGRIVQLVLETNRAWHARTSGMSYFGIEHEGGSGLGSIPILWHTEWDAERLEEDDKMLRRSARLTAYLCTKWGIEIQHDFEPRWVPQRDSKSVIAGHAQMLNNDHMDPGPRFPWRAYMHAVHNIAGR